MRGRGLSNGQGELEGGARELAFERSCGSGLGLGWAVLGGERSMCKDPRLFTEWQVTYGNGDVLACSSRERLGEAIRVNTALVKIN